MKKAQTQGQQRADPLTPSLALLSKLASIAVHAEELISPQGHGFDRITLESLLNDPEVKAWLEAMGPFRPVIRRTP